MKHLTEKEKKIAVRALRAYHEFCGNQFSSIDRFIKEHQLEEPNIKLGKWYKSDKSLLFCQSLYSDIMPKFRGFGFEEGEWVENEAGYSQLFSWEEAEDKEVKEALVKEAIKRGFIDGALVKCQGKEFELISKFKFNSKMNVLSASIKHEDGIVLIMKDGTWAEAIPNKTAGIHDRISNLENELAELKKLL